MIQYSSKMWPGIRQPGESQLIYRVVPDSLKGEFVNATTLKGDVDSVFAKIEGLRVFRLFPHKLAWVKQVHAAILTDIDAIATTIPVGSPWTVIADAIITFIEGKYPQWKMELEWLRTIIDALFATAPTTTLPAA
jgi:hypothetical protein